MFNVGRVRSKSFACVNLVEPSWNPRNVDVTSIPILC